MYPGFCDYSGIVRPTDETIALKNSYSELPRGKGMPHHSGPHGEQAPALVSSQKEKRYSMNQRLFVVFTKRNGQSRVGKMSRFRTE